MKKAKKHPIIAQRHSFEDIFRLNIFIMRPICNTCNKNYRAINYKKNNITHYRSLCNSCKRVKEKLKPGKPKWSQSGYNKKPTCDLCGFRSLYSSQIAVFHIDGNLENVDYINLRSICLNCIEVVKNKKVNWRRGDLQVDY